MFFECTPAQIHQYGLIFSLFLGGLMGGLTHCTLMCAPFVLSFQQKQVGRVSSILLLPYHLGRMTTYIGLGVCSYFFLAYAFPVSGLREWLSAVVLTLAALLFWIQAFPVLGNYVPFLAHIHIPAPFGRIERGILRRLLEQPGPLALYLTGVLLGFIPCGLVMGALLAVSTAASATQAALGMAAFTMGTVPSLILVAIGGKTLATFLPRGGGAFIPMGTCDKRCYPAYSGRATPDLIERKTRLWRRM